VADDKGCVHKCIVQVHQVIADLPAKALLLNHLQYNERFGCSKCLHPGTRLESGARVYQYETCHGPRTADSVKEHACQAELNRRPVIHTVILTMDGR
jgi:hypothetical protein